MDRSLVYATLDRGYLMIRFFLFFTILGFYSFIMLKITSNLGYVLDGTTLFAAFCVAIATTFTWFYLYGWWSAIERFFQPQSVSSQTRDTPSQIGCAALLALVFIVLTIVVGIYLMIQMI